MIDLEPYRSALERVCRAVSLRSLDLVGSGARKDLRSDSDLDFLVTFQGDTDLFRRYFDLKERLEHIFERPVDLIEERAVRNPYLRKALERDRVRVYGT
jgi:predicted nucleotidyltransferase